MGSLKAELRRFEKRRLRPILRKLKRSRREVGPPAGSTAAMEQLLAALIRSELRRAESKPHVWSALAATLQARLTGTKPPPPRDLQGLVRTMLATPVHPAPSTMRLPAVAPTPSPADRTEASRRRAA